MLFDLHVAGDSPEDIRDSPKLHTHIPVRKKKKRKDLKRDNAVLSASLLTFSSSMIYITIYHPFRIYLYFQSFWLWL